MAQEHPITRLGGWAGYEVVEDWQERRGGKSWCVLRLEAVTGWLRQCSHCGESTRAVHDQQERRIRELPIFEYRVELVVPRVRVACARCGPRLERLSWLEPYARLTRRLGESVAQLCRVASIRHVASFFGLDWKTVKDLDFASLQRQLGDVDFRILTAGQRAGDDVAPWVHARRARTQGAGPDLFFDPRVIVGDLLQLSGAQHVNAAVADVRDAGAVRAGQERRCGRRHAAKVVRIGDRRGDSPVGETERGFEAVGFETEGGFERKRPGAVLVGAGRLLDEDFDGFDGDPRRHFAGDVPAHPVRDDVEAEIGTGAVTIFVAAPSQSGV